MVVLRLANAEKLFYFVHSHPLKSAYPYIMKNTSKTNGVLSTGLRCSLLTLCAITVTSRSFGQAVTEIITDYNGYWKSASASPNAQKPNDAYNLLAFTYNGTRYSTGVNDVLLATHSESFTTGDFWSLPVSSMTGTITSNTKVGLGAMYDGVSNGASNPPPEWSIYGYLTDGQKGLGLGTCIANLPVGSMSFQLSQIQPSSIGDGVPDILVTQVADPTGNSFDRYEFVDANGIRVGSYKDIVFTNIQPVGTWTADFYEATNNPLTLQSGFTKTDRPIRLWAADLSEFGITAANSNQIKNFKINLCGNSDVAFVAYNSQSIQFVQTLSVQLPFFEAKRNSSGKLITWEANAELSVDHYEIERSGNGRDFVFIGGVNSKKAAGTNYYFFTDPERSSDKAFYRLRMVDDKGKTSFSKTVILENAPNANVVLRLWPNPANELLSIKHDPVTKATVSIVTNAGIVLRKVQLPQRSVRNQVSVSDLAVGTYHLIFQNENEKTVETFTIQR